MGDRVSHHIVYLFNITKKQFVCKIYKWPIDNYFEKSFSRSWDLADTIVLIEISKFERKTR
jgi:hypothetical protein